MKDSKSTKKVEASLLTDASVKIKTLCEQSDLEVTDKRAVLKKLVKNDSFCEEKNFTRWARTVNGVKGLVVLKTNGSIKFYPNPQAVFAIIKTISC